MARRGLTVVAAGALSVAAGCAPVAPPPTAAPKPHSLVVGTDQIWLVEPATGGVRALTPPGAHDSYPAWSRDGSRIAYVNHLGKDPVRVIDADGTEPRPITAGFGTSEPVAWSPDGRRIAFFGYPVPGGPGQWRLYVANADGTGVHPLETGMSSIRRIAWSPDGRAIAFVGPSGDRVDEGGGQGRVYVVDTESGQVTRVSDSPVVDDDNGPLSWTPASEIAYAVQRTDNADTPGIALAAPTASGWTERIMVPRPGASRDLSVTAVGDGGRFAFISAADRLNIVNRDGSGLRELSREPVFARGSMCVAPDGSAVAASTGDGPGGIGGSDVLIVAGDGSGSSLRIRVGQVPASGPACSWRPVER